MATARRVAIPLSERPLDLLFVGFFCLNLLVITYQIDLEQLVIADPDHFTYPLWPPRFMVDAVHWWGRTYDHLLMARPMFWKMTIWIDVVFFGPFYALAIWTFATGREWIRPLAIVWAAVMMTNVPIILGEEFFGVWPTPGPCHMVAANAAWLGFPVLLLWRLGWTEHPFSRPADG